MRKVTVAGRAIQNLSGLRTSLLAQGFQIEGLTVDNNGGQPYTCVCMADADLKNPTAAVQAFADSPPLPGSAATLTAPDGSKWVVRVDNNGSLTTSKLT